MDITDFFTWFMNQFITIVGWVFGTLNNITINGVSLLMILITIVVIGTIIPILMTIPRVEREVVRERRTKNDNKSE